MLKVPRCYFLITEVALLVMVAVPAELAAVTTTLRRRPTYLSPEVKLALVACEIARHFFAFALHFFHRYLKLVGVAPVHVSVLAATVPSLF